MIPTRIVLVGDQGVGKTSLLDRYLFNKHDPKVTVGIAAPTHLSPQKTSDILNKYQSGRDIRDKKNYRVEFRDTSGDINYRFMLDETYKKATAFVLVLSVADRKSFLHLDQWRDKLQLIKSQHQLIVIANKVDYKEISETQLKLIEESKESFGGSGPTWQVSRKQIQDKVDSWNLGAEVYFTSAKYQAFRDEVNEAFQKVVALAVLKIHHKRQSFLSEPEPKKKCKCEIF